MVWSYREKEEYVKKVYVSEAEDPKKKGRPVVRWKDRVKEYVNERDTDRGEGI